MDWSAKQYLKFEDERTRPARDLLAAIPTLEPKRVIDLGCGPGNSTELLVERYPNAEISGIDSSPDMVANARKRLPKLSFEVADIVTFDPGTSDVIFANAVFQFVPDHARLLPRLAGALRPGGTLAFQVPDNRDEPSHVPMREIARSGPWADKLRNADAVKIPIETPRWYYDLLTPHCQRVDIWRTVYQHALADIDAIVEWFKATGLRQYLAPLDEIEKGEYLARYRAALAASYPTRADGKVLLAFPRLFVVATR